MSTTNCPPPQEPNPDQLVAMLPLIEQAAGLRTCQTSASSSSFEASGETSGLLDIVAGFRIDASGNQTSTSTLGCDQFAAICRQVYMTQSVINCILHEHKNEYSSVISASNSLILSHVKFNCKTFDLSQNINIRAIQVSQISEEIKSQIENETHILNENILDILQKSASEWASTPQGNKALAELQTKINAYNTNQNITKFFNDYEAKVEANNGIYFGESEITADSCYISQDITIDVMAKQLVVDNLNTFFSTTFDVINKDQEGMTQISVNKGPLDTISKYLPYILLFVGIIVIGYIIYRMLSKPKSTNISSNNTASNTSSTTSSSASTGNSMSGVVESKFNFGKKSYRF